MDSHRSLRLTEKGLKKLEEAIAREGKSDNEIAIKPPMMSVNTVYKIRRREQGATHSSLRKLFQKLKIPLTESDYESLPPANEECGESLQEQTAHSQQPRDLLKGTLPTLAAGGRATDQIVTSIEQGRPAVIRGESPARRRLARRRKALLASCVLFILVVAGGFAWAMFHPADLDPQLVKAVERSDVESARGLLTRGASPNALRRSDGSSVLMIATANDSDEMVQLLLNKGADHDLRSRPWGQFALMVASAKGYGEIANTLLLRGAYVDERDRFDTTSLIVAARCGHIGIVRELLSSGADINATDVDGHSALWEAEQYSPGPVVHLLIAKGESQKFDLHEASAGVLNPTFLTCVSVPSIRTPPVIDGGADSLSSWKSLPRNPISMWNEKGRIVEEDVRLAHDKQFLYCAVTHAWRPKHDSYMNILLSESASRTLDGSAKLPYRTLLLSQGSPGSWRGYNGCFVLIGKEYIPPDGSADTVSASWGMGESNYEFKIPLADFGISSGNHASLRLMPINGTDGSGYGDLKPFWMDTHDPSTWISLALQ